MGKSRFAILLGVQHLDFDGSSISIFASEFHKLYQSYMNQTPLELDTAVGYDEYIDWQKKYEKERMPFDQEFFKGMYGIGKITVLPDYDKKYLGVPRTATKISVIKDKNFVQQLDCLAEKGKVSRFAVILAAYARFISSILNEDIVTIAMIVNGRSELAFKKTIGPFSAPFPIQIAMGKGLSDQDLIEQCNYKIIEINARSFYPVADLVSAIPNYKTLPIETYFSDIGINYTNYKPSNEKLFSNNYRIIEILSQVSEPEFDVFNHITFKRIPGLHLVINELKDDIAFNFYYQMERFEEKILLQWIDIFFDKLEQLML